MRFLAIAVAALLFEGAPIYAQRDPIVEEILDRATVSVEAFMKRFTRIVAEERYVQEYLDAGVEGSRGSFTAAPRVRERRTLTSDLLLVKPDQDVDWQVFRDVFDVDGREVRNREPRLAKLFIDSRDTANALQRARDIAAASAAFNIRPIGTVDNPYIALGLLQRQYRTRLRFTPRGRDESVGPDARLFEFRETAKPTLMRGSGDKDIVARGRYWIDGASGRMLRSELIFSSLGTDSMITTSFAIDDALGTNVPSEMRFRRSASSGTEVRGTANYSRFRQFEVGTTEEVVKTPESKKR